MRVLAQVNQHDLKVDDLEQVVFTRSDSETLQSVTGEVFDTIVLTHPIGNGVIGQLKSRTPHTPILVMIPFDEPGLIEHYLVRGAFSYLVPGVSINTIQLLIRATEDIFTRNLIFGPLVLSGRQLAISGKKIKLSERESAMLRLMMTNPRYWVSREDFLALAGYKKDTNTHTTETHIYRLRQKLMTNGAKNIIVTVDGGYQLQLP
jgi:DNA-binding response OmpR family regulator